MLKISVIEAHSQCRLVLQGKLMDPWIGVLKMACENAVADLHGRELVIDIDGLTLITLDGERVLLELMEKTIPFRCNGAFDKEVVRQLAQKTRSEGQEALR